MRYDYGHGEARVNAERKRDAEKVLKRNGRTYSDLIRDLTDYLADTGGGTAGIRASDALPIQERERGKKQELIQRFADRNLPEAEGDLSDEEILAQARMERFGERDETAV